MEEFQLALTKYSIRLYNLLVENMNGRERLSLYETLDYYEERTKEAMAMLVDAGLIEMLYSRKGISADSYLVRML